MASRPPCLFTNLAKYKAIPNACLSAKDPANLPLAHVSQKYSSAMVASPSSL